MNEHFPFVNPPLPYDYDALEPFIDTKTMELHHDRHLQTYVDNLNKALKDYPDVQTWSLEELIENIEELPSEIQTPVRNNGGGVYNHIFYFDGLTPHGTNTSAGALYRGIVNDFGSTGQFFNEFKEQALSVFGSGYAWLVVNPDGKLEIISRPNQDAPIMQDVCPVLGIDVWEHAYYLKHYNMRVDYINDWFQIINWKHANSLYNQCLMNRKTDR